MADISTPSKSRLDMLKEKVQGKYPDDKFETDDDYIGRYADDYDSQSAELEKAKNDLSSAMAKNEKIENMFRTDARSARFMADWAAGKDPLIELYKRYGDEAVEVLQDPDKLEEFRKERESYLKEMTDQENSEKEMLSKVDEVMAKLDEIEQSGQMSKEDIDSNLEKMHEIATKYLTSGFDIEDLKEMQKLREHDKLVSEAGMAGEVRGKNAKMKEELRKPTKGDGLPDLEGGGNIPTNDRKAPDMGALNRYSGEPDIFARGGEKRIKRT